MLTRLMKKKVEEGEERNLEIDKLSRLPEELVIHILSFLETKEAIQACFSLKKWVNLWTLIPNLHFDTNLFKNFSSFDKFVSKVLALHDGSVIINKFLYRRRNMIICEFQPEVLKFVASHEVQDLTIDFWDGGDNVMDHIGDSVRNLKLCSFRFCRSICLKQMVTVNLQLCRFLEPELFSGCPNLKNLTLCMCLWTPHVSPLTIVAPQLSRLTMLYCFSTRSIDPPKLILSTPRLTSLKIFDCNLPLLQTGDLAFLDTVDVDVDYEMDLSISNETRLQLFSTFISLLKCFHSAKSVRLSSDMVKLLSEFPDELAREPSPFCNLWSVNIVSLHSETIPIMFPGLVMNYLIGKSPHAKTVFEEQKVRTVLMDAYGVEG